MPFIEALDRAMTALVLLKPWADRFGGFERAPIVRAHAYAAAGVPDMPMADWARLDREALRWLAQRDLEAFR